MEHACTYYLAGSFVHRARLRDIRRQIAERHPDWRCRARWLDFDDETERNPELVAAMDAHDALTSDAMVFVRGLPSSPGKHTELGFALAHGIPVHVITPPWRAIVKSGVRRVVHAAALLSSMTSTPSLNLTPWMSFAR